jgi:hypothetical protein
MSPRRHFSLGIEWKYFFYALQFTEDFQPLFPLAQIRDEDFWRLLGDGDMPRILLVQDGRILRVWDESVPDENMIRDSLPLSGF